MTRLTNLWLRICALAVVGFLPVSSRADPPVDCPPYHWQGVNHGSYSPLHYWIPRLYTCRAYHRPGYSYEQYPDVVTAQPDAAPDDSKAKDLRKTEEPKK